MPDRQDRPPTPKPRKKDSKNQQPADEGQNESDEPLLPDYLGTHIDLEA
jgi:hypothetical protein